MLVCPMAANAPSTVDAMATNTMICCHWPVIDGKACSTTRTSNATAAVFGATAKKPVTGVGAPS